MVGKSTYPKDAPAQVRELAKTHTDGMTDEEVAAHFGVQDRTIRNWAKRNPDFLQALIDCRALIDGEVERSLYRATQGYVAEEVKEFREVTYDENGKQVERVVRREVTKKYVAPNTTAQIFWLKNRRPRDWRDKQEVEHTGNLVINLKAADMGAPDE